MKTRKALAIASLIILTLLFMNNIEATNLLTDNPGFETTDLWWNDHEWYENDSYTLEYDSTVKRTGSQSVYIENTGTLIGETEQGQADFDYAGSLCHGWSATPAYFYGAYILGVKPLSPGFKTFTIDPFFKATPQASGSIPTPAGNITISWQENTDKDGNKSVIGKITYPKCLKISSQPKHFKLNPYS